MSWQEPLGVVVVTVVAMEVIATIVHRFVMHGMGWSWHRSHHQPRAHWFERNDLYAICFAILSILLFWLGGWVTTLWWMGAGMVVYGLLYAALHDGLVHRRLASPRPPKRGYLKRLVQAHRLHHAVHERDGAVSFGFLYAPPVPKLIRKMRSLHGGK